MFNRYLTIHRIVWLRFTVYIVLSLLWNIGLLYKLFSVVDFTCTLKFVHEAFK